ncbi:hypothetical protein, partial [Serratia grimesii]|uniref:hypothetical protein n=1 Tax=Serratia grimesii TaxID=82995 RepID=UPI002240CECF
PAFNPLFLITKVVFNNIANNNIPSVTRVEQPVPRQPVIIHFSLKKTINKKTLSLRLGFAGRVSFTYFQGSSR